MRVYLGLGSNIGDRESNLLDAIERLGREVEIELISSPYDTEPVGYDHQPRFLNAVVGGDTGLSPDDLLKLVKKIEDDMGRATTFVNGPRLIDIDILLCGDIVLDSEFLTVPHARYAERAFVLVPLAQIAPNVVCPLRHKSVRVLLNDLKDPGQIIRKDWARSQHV
ncbi:MAG: 2-amino-4-hydroxy-6-hydroxymethyldihydropteridine diphosphokinase [Chloroflexi bacterium]|jgi:2-amino-4-hydroxy-6-hydroxymethyldihydropteridine diphosphokinase|nr:2-amino-4-hydroxy-6-hydroxymethyldihydropteridine diphosphokinase [Chloroflexota bacterium]MBT7081480.1 2-amino-4-hydroxy-6-hydroxymethyldihydropteridine diphosphokinase [Chloroflexota bacterium]MBT7289761.1 2-amino-4-hydroxy-6-hydroxymethyldihydropteridine diphosphokinase [Chloroflexota bacterium]